MTAPDLIVTCQIYQNLIGVVVVRANIHNTFLSHSYNYAHLDYVKSKRGSPDSNSFGNELSFLFEDIQFLSKEIHTLLTETAAYRQEAPIGG
jgi:hypothetical protein